MKKAILTAGCLIIIAARSFAAAANDPIQIGTSARLLGLGRSFVAVADDSGALFVNPAGLAQLDNWSVGSMFGKHINEYDQLVFSGAVPLAGGAIGLGYTSYSISIDIPSLESISGNPFPIISGEANYKYGVFAYPISYARKLDFISGDLLGGATLKLYSGEFSGTGITALTASGMDLDLGLLYKVNPALRLGLALQSILPASLGGKLHWSDNTDETFPATVKAGFLTKLRDNLSLSLDGDYFPTQSGLPTLFHAGVEWLPIKMLAVRGGIDQSFKEDQAVNNLSFGVGVNIGGFAFDYAYHTYFDVSQFASNYFSLSYSPQPGEKKRVIKDYFELAGPASVATSAEAVDLAGRVLERAVRRLIMNGETVEVGKDGAFARDRLPLRYGANRFAFSALDDKGGIIDSKEVKVVRFVEFTDVAADHWARKAIEDLATLGIMPGLADGQFGPENFLTKDSLAEVLIAASAEVETYKAPKKRLTRAEALVMISRALKLPLSDVMEAPFQDLPGRHWAAREITAAKTAGLLKYLEDKPFEPNRSITRAEVAEIIAASAGIAPRLRELSVQ